MIPCGPRDRTAAAGGRTRRPAPAATALACALALLLALPATAPPAHAQAAPAAGATAATAPLREVEGIAEYRLANGVQVLLFPDEGSTTVTVNVVYRVGSVQEGYGETGMAHLLEHMLFKGTPNHPDIPKLLAGLGVRTNATTSFDRTNYFSNFNASEATLQAVLRLEADRMLNSRIAAEDLAREMPVVRNEFERTDSNGMATLIQRVQAVAYDWQAYGHPPIGSRADIEAVDIGRLKEFYRRWYRPDRATVMVAGRIDAAATLAQIRAAFEPLPNPATPLPAPPATVEPPQDGERRVLVRRPGGQPAVYAQWHTPAITHPDSAALSVLGAMLSQAPSGPLYKQLVETRRAAQAVAGANARASSGEFAGIAVASTEGDAAALGATLFDVIEGRNRPPFTQADLERVKSQVANGYEQLLRKPELVVMLLSEMVAVGDWRAIFAQLQRLRAVTLDDVDRVAATYLKPSNRTWGEYLPTATPERVVVPAAPPIAEMLAGLDLRSTIAAPERFDATPENLEARTQRRTLPSGIRLSTLPKQNRGNAVTLTMRARWGERSLALAEGSAYEVLGDLILEGSTTRDRQALQDRLLQLKTTASVSSGMQGWALTLNSDRANLIPALEVLAEALQNPALPEAALARDKAARVASLQGLRDRPNQRLDEAWRGHLNAADGLGPEDWWDPRYSMSLDDRISRLQRIGIDDVRAFHQRHWSARDATIGVAGGVPDGLDAALERLFGTWRKDTPPYKRFTAAHRPLPAARLDAAVPNQANAELRMLTRFALKQPDPDYMPMLLAVRILGDDPLVSRLATRVRQQEGLSYGIGANLFAGYFDDRAGLQIQGSFAPANRERILAAVNDEIARALRDGFSADELERARTSLMESRRTRRAADGALVDELLWHAEVGKTFAEMSENDARIRAVTLEQVNAVFRRLVDPARFVTGVAGSFEGVAQNPVK
jgi:zinc protease